MTFVKTHNPFSKTFDGLLNDLFTELPVSFGKTLREDVLHFPPANILEKENGYSIQLNVPGFEKADFSIKLDNKILTVNAEKKEDINKETNKIIRQEFSVKSFKRSFTVDEKVDAGSIVAAYENGILTITIPKKEEVKDMAKEITIL